MKTRYKVIIIVGISIPVVLFGLFALVMAINVSNMLENSERWMVKLEPHIDLSDDQLELQLREESLKRLVLYRVETLENYYESLNPNWVRNAKEAFGTENRFVVYVDERHEYSKQQVEEIFTDVEGIQESRHLHDWLLNKG